MADYFSTVTILEYNTHLFGDTIPSLKKNVFYEDQARAHYLAEKILSIQPIQPDIVGLCEVWANDYKEKIADDLKSIYPYWCYDNNNLKTEMGSGLMILSRYPMQKPHFIQFDEPSLDFYNSDSLAQKGFLAVPIGIGTEAVGLSVLFILTHTQSGSYPEVRMSQLKQMLKWIDDNYPRGYIPAFIFGDLNVVAEDKNGSPTQEYNDYGWHFAKYGFGDTYRSQWPPAYGKQEDPCYTADGINNKLQRIFAPNTNQERVDFMYSRLTEDSSGNGLYTLVGKDRVTARHDFIYKDKEANIDAMDISDHYPLYGIFELHGALPFAQFGWRYCSNCEGLFYGAWINSEYAKASKCPATGGNHRYENLVDSYNYILGHELPPYVQPVQSQWRYCSNCQGLFYGPDIDKSACPAGGKHVYTDESSYNYGLFYTQDVSNLQGVEVQPDWRYCGKCTGLFYGPMGRGGVCPSDGKNHDGEGSINYTLKYIRT
jgi:endonuclease/exonuclease/phosphatase family metal-dependent hydrolase